MSKETLRRIRDPENPGVIRCHQGDKSWPEFDHEATRLEARRLALQSLQLSYFAMAMAGLAVVIQLVRTFA